MSHSSVDPAEGAYIGGGGGGGGGGDRTGYTFCLSVDKKYIRFDK